MVDNTSTDSKVPHASALSTLIGSRNAKSAQDALSLEILHNLQYQHGWTDLKLHRYPGSRSSSPLSSRNIPASSLPTFSLESTSATVSSSHPTSSPSSMPSMVRRPSQSPSRRVSGITLVSGVPPHHLYVHPDFQSHLIKHDISLPTDPPSASSSAGAVHIPIPREFVLPLIIGQKFSLKYLSSVFDKLDDREALHGKEGLVWKDAKRLVMGMLSQNGMGGDGTIAYYIVQEGEVKPRQNG